MKYTLYKITNNINGKIYVGVHKTENIDDDYMGSGKILKRAIEKYGLENFTKEILEVYDNPEDMFDAEAKIVNEDFVKRDDNYNIKEGGFGGWDHINDDSEDKKEYSRKGREETNKILEERWGETWRSELGKLGNDGRDKDGFREAGLKSAKTILERYGKYYFSGKIHTEESKRKIGEANSIHQKGKGNSQYGTRWIHNLELKKSKKIKKEEVLPEGWLEGRKMKFYA